MRGLLAGPARALVGTGAVAEAVAKATPASSPKQLAPIARGLALAAPLLLVFGALFAGADEAFARLAEDALPTADDFGTLPSRALVFAAVVALAGGLALVLRDGVRDEAREPRRRIGATEWLVALVALDLLFAAFVAVQMTPNPSLPAYMTYADYAREGFGQLLVAAALTLAVVAGALRYGPSGRATAIRVALGVLALLTFAVLASALQRLDLYQDAYGATRLRFAAHGAMLVVGVLLALVAAAVATARYAWLPRASAATLAAFLLTFVAVDPDRRIAERNVARGDLDEAYLRTLSADAAPALPLELRDRPAPDGLWGFNLSRREAREGGRSD